MSRYGLLIAAMIGPFYAPVLFVVCVTLAAAVYFPLAPLAVGILEDSLYYGSKAGSLPYATLFGGLSTAIAFVVRTFARTRIMRG